MSDYKYSEQISSLHNCPPTNYSPQATDAYRFVYKSNPERSYIPVAKGNPKRINDRSDMKKCQAWGLSFFNTEENAIAKFEDLKRRNKNIAKTIGDSIALVKLEESDGVCSPVGEKGHFTLHERGESKFSERNEVIKELS
ncbi:MAG: hypothetical protein ACRBF0_10085 [Calditrichia bacterium]